MKKLLTSLTLAGVIACATAFSGCDRLLELLNYDKDKGGDAHYSETYKGSVSEETYGTKAEAVGGYLETEISGKSTTAVLVDYTVEEELSKTEVAKLEIPKEYTADLQTVEKLTVEYSEIQNITDGYARAVAVAESKPVTYKRTVYLLTYTDMFRFFVPALDNGEGLTSSYYDSTFEAEKYVNCTMDAEISTVEKSGGYTSSYTQKAKAKATFNALYEYDTRISDNSTYYSELYMVDTVDGIYQASREIGEKFSEVYKVPSEYGNTINEYFMLWFDARFGQLDHTFFEKTATGYALKGDKYAEFLAAQQFNIDVENCRIEYIINIADGRMADVKMLVENGGNSYKMTIKFSDFGTTKINVPNEVKALLPQ